MFKKARRRRRILDLAQRLDPPRRAALFRGAVARGETDQRLLRDLVDLAIEGNEDDAALPKYREALRAGRRVKIANYPVTFLSFDGVDADLVYQIEEVFRYAD